MKKIKIKDQVKMATRNMLSGKPQMFMLLLGKNEAILENGYEMNAHIINCNRDEYFNNFLPNGYLGVGHIRLTNGAFIGFAQSFRWRLRG